MPRTTPVPHPWQRFAALGGVPCGPQGLLTACVAAIRLLDEWMADDSGYDEENWPELEEALDRNRREAGQYRKLFES